MRRPWLPRQADAAMQPCELEAVCVRGSSFEASAFFQGAFRSGFFIAIADSDYVFLELETG
jgi:hypothetical protein